VKPNALLIHPEDNVAVALEEIPVLGEVRLGGAEPLRAADRIPFAHKLAARAIAQGEAVVKYGAPVAFALRDIAPGEWVHAHNVKSYFLARREQESQ
jgi:altronate hydrolase